MLDLPHLYEQPDGSLKWVWWNPSPEERYQRMGWGLEWAEDAAEAEPECEAARINAILAEDDWREAGVLLALGEKKRRAGEGDFKDGPELEALEAIYSTGWDRRAFSSTSRYLQTCHPEEIHIPCSLGVPGKAWWDRTLRFGAVPCVSTGHWMLGRYIGPA